MVQSKKDRSQKSSDPERSDSPFSEPVVLPIEDSIDLHAFFPKEIPSVVEEYILQRCPCRIRRLGRDRCRLEGLRSFCSPVTGNDTAFGKSSSTFHPLKRIFAFGSNEAIKGQGDADRDEAIGEVKGGPVESRPVEI
jgi:hypothetical protein